MSLPGNDLLTSVENPVDLPTLGRKLGQYLRRYVATSIQGTASNAGVAPNGNLAAPAPPESISVTTAGELMQVVVNHTAPISKGVQYITHIATNQQFTNPIIVDHGSSRCPPHISLPTKTGDGTATHNYYVATIAQYPGSPPSAPTYFGGVTPAPVTMSGTTQMDIQPGTGSGTAVNGGQPFVGLGKSQVRLQQGPKRSVNGS
jgi:hypothetical protein